MANPPLTQVEQQFETPFLPPEQEQNIPMGQLGLLFEGPNLQELFSPAAVSCTSRSPGSDLDSSISIFSVKNKPFHTFPAPRWLSWNAITRLAERRCHQTFGACSSRAPVSSGGLGKSNPSAMQSILPLGTPVQHRAAPRGCHPGTARCSRS